MHGMFWGTGYVSSKFEIDCTNWNVNKVTDYSKFNTSVTDKVKEPNWIN